MSDTEAPFRPLDAESFRTALIELLTEASSNGVEIGNRSWKCGAKPGDAWDVEIVEITDSPPEEDHNP